MPPKLSDGFEDTGFEATSFCTFFGMCLMLEELIGELIKLKISSPKALSFKSLSFLRFWDLLE